MDALGKLPWVEQSLTPLVLVLPQALVVLSILTNNVGESGV
jgi:hypothetical protein